jgi:hypothetical protein
MDQVGPAGRPPRGQGARPQQPGQGEGAARRRRPAVHLASVGQPLGQPGRVAVAADRDAAQPFRGRQPLRRRGDGDHLDPLGPQRHGQPEQEPPGQVAHMARERVGQEHDPQ